MNLLAISRESMRTLLTREHVLPVLKFTNNHNCFTFCVYIYFLRVYPAKNKTGLDIILIINKNVIFRNLTVKHNPDVECSIVCFKFTVVIMLTNYNLFTKSYSCIKHWIENVLID